MRIFKQEQMYMVEEYYTLKNREKQKMARIEKQNRIMIKQERLIAELTCFVHDCLDVIFLKAASKQE